MYIKMGGWIFLCLSGVSVLAAPVASTMSQDSPPVAVTQTFDKASTLWRVAVDAGYVVVSHSSDRGKSFSRAVRVNTQPETILADGENRPKIIVARNGDVYVSYTQGLEKPYSGHIRFSRSWDHGRTFSEPVTVNDNHEIISHRFETMQVDRQGRIHIAWLDRREASAAQKNGQAYAGISLYYAKSSDRGVSFSPNQRLAEHTCECCRVAMAIDASDTPVLFWRHVFPANIRDHALLRVDGKSKLTRASYEGWQIDSCPHHGGAFSIDADGLYHAVWFSGGGKRPGLFYARSSDQGRLFSTPVAVGRSDRLASHADVLSVGKNLYLAWKEFDGERSLAYVQVSHDAGHTWSAPQLVAKSVGANDHPMLIRNADQAFLSWNTLDNGVHLIALSQ